MGMEGGRMENNNKVLGIMNNAFDYCLRDNKILFPLLVAAFQSLLASHTSHFSCFSIQLSACFSN
jgi:hypothetical protein